MKWSHIELISHEVDICNLVIKPPIQKNVYTLDAFLLSFRRLADKAFSAEVALKADKIEGRSTVVIRSIEIKRQPLLFPVLDDPSQARRVTMHRCLVNRQVTIFVMCIPNLVFTSWLLSRRREDLV